MPANWSVEVIEMHLSGCIGTRCLSRAQASKTREPDERTLLERAIGRNGNVRESMVRMRPEGSPCRLTRLRGVAARLHAIRVGGETGRRPVVYQA